MQANREKEFEKAITKPISFPEESLEESSAQDEDTSEYSENNVESSRDDVEPELVQGSEL